MADGEIEPVDPVVRRHPARVALEESHCLLADQGLREKLERPGIRRANLEVQRDDGLPGLMVKVGEV